MIELPPILTGDEQHQIQQLRDYLIRLARQLNEEMSPDVALKDQLRVAADGG